MKSNENINIPVLKSVVITQNLSSENLNKANLKKTWYLLGSYNTAIEQGCIKLVCIWIIDRAYTLEMFETFSLFL